MISNTCLCFFVFNAFYRVYDFYYVCVLFYVQSVLQSVQSVSMSVYGFYVLDEWNVRLDANDESRENDELDVYEPLPERDGVWSGMCVPGVHEYRDNCHELHVYERLTLLT